MIVIKRVRLWLSISDHLKIKLNSPFLENFSYPTPSYHLNYRHTIANEQWIIFVISNDSLMHFDTMHDLL